MIDKNKIKQIRSEAARVGYFNLPMAPVMDHAKGAIKKSYIGLKESTEKKIRSFQSVKESFKSNIANSKTRMTECEIDTVEIICTSVLVFVISAVLLLWKDLVLAPISLEYTVPIGFLVAGATMGGIYTVVQKKQDKKVNSFVIYGIVAFVIVITFLFSLHSLEVIHLLKSAVIAGFVGLIVFITNNVLLPTCRGTLKALVYVKDILFLSFSHIGLVIAKLGLSKSFSKMKSTNRKMTQEINEIESLLIIDFMLGKESNVKNNELKQDKSEEEAYYA